MTTLLVMIFFQVVNRFVLHIPAAWTEEMGRYNFVWLTLFGSVKALKMRVHLSVDILVMNLGGKGKKVVEIISEIMTLIFCLILLQTGLSYTMTNINNYCEFGEFPISIIYVAIPISAFLLSLISIEQIIVGIKDLIHGRVDEKEIKTV